MSRLPLTAALALCLASPALAQPALAQPAAPVVSSAWSRATAAGQPTGVVYLTITASTPDQLLSAASPVADSATAHETVETNGVMQMRPVPALDLPSGKPVVFAPGGLHIMLIGLHQPLQPGAHFPLTLHFAHAAAVTTEVTVGRAGAASAPMSMPMSMPGMAHDSMKP